MSTFLKFLKYIELVILSIGRNTYIVERVSKDMLVNNHISKKGFIRLKVGMSDIYTHILLLQV